METLILFLAPDVQAGEIAESISDRLDVAPFRELPIYVHRGKDRVYIEDAPDIEHEYGPGELDWVASIIEPRRAWTLSYHSLEFIKEVAAPIIRRFGGAVDTTGDWKGTGAEFLGRLAEQPDWDWFESIREATLADERADLLTRLVAAGVLLTKGNRKGCAPSLERTLSLQSLECIDGGKGPRGRRHPRGRP